MLNQLRIDRGNQKSGIEQLRANFKGMEDVGRIRADVQRLVAARYFVVFLGAAMLFSLVAQALFLDAAMSLDRVLKVALVAILGPGLVWAASDKEVRLLRELDKRNRQLEQRIRENKALNQMTQAHLADCLTSVPPRQEVHQGPRMLEETNKH